MAHNGSCARAKSHGCECIGCGGSKHGWPSRVEMAEDRTGSGRVAFRARADQVWAEWTARRRARPNLPTKAAGCDTAVADIMDWLADEPSAIDLVRRFGHALSTDVFEKVDGLPGERPARRSAMVDHFWCDLLAASAHAIADLKKLPGQVAETVTSVIFDERRRKGRPLVERTVVRAAADSTSKAIEGLFPAFPSDLDTTLRTMRILAAMICPAPERHSAVYRYCVKPLADEGKGIIKAETEQRLMKVFPAERP
jgi:hypothetical protein